MKFGEKLKALREKNNLTQSAVARELGVTQRTISYYENNNSAPNDPDVLNKLVKLFNITLDDLFSQSEGPKSQVHQLVEKLISDTQKKDLTWEIFEGARYEHVSDGGYRSEGYCSDLMDQSKFTQYKDCKFQDEQSYFSEFDDGGYLIEKIILPSKEIDLALFALYQGGFLFIANKDSLTKIEDLYVIISNEFSGVNNYIDKYLKTDLSLRRIKPVTEIFPDEEVPF